MVLAALSLKAPEERAAFSGTPRASDSWRGLYSILLTVSCYLCLQVLGFVLPLQQELNTASMIFRGFLPAALGRT